MYVFCFDENNSFHLLSEIMTATNNPACSYLIVSHFDIDRGSIVKDQYPTKMGVSESYLAELMLPEGVHLREMDWTVFFLKRSVWHVFERVDIFYLLVCLPACLSACLPACLSVCLSVCLSFLAPLRS